MEEGELTHEGLRYVQKLLGDLPMETLPFGFRERIANARDMLAGFCAPDHDLLLLDKTVFEIVTMVKNFAMRKLENPFAYTQFEDGEIAGFNKAGEEMLEYLKKTIGIHLPDQDSL